MTRLPAVAATLIALGLAAPGMAHATVLPGIQVDGLTGSSALGVLHSDLDSARALHMQLVRIEIPWSSLQPRSPAAFDARYVSAVDRFMSDATAHDVRVMVTLQDTPCWATTAPVSAPCEPGHRGITQTYPPSDPATYGVAAAFLARRYGGGPLAAIEVWNEPDINTQAYFGGPDKPKRYAAILKAAYTAIKAAQPRVKVLGGSLVGSNGNFLRALYANGIRGHYDALSVHYYDLVLAQLRQIHQVQLANHDHTPIWLGEFGWTSCRPQTTQDTHTCVTRQIQATNLVDVLRALRHKSWMQAALVYSLRDSPGSDFGLRSVGGAIKPAFTAIARTLGAHPGTSRPVHLRLTRSGGSILATGSGPAGDVYSLTAHNRAGTRLKGTFRLDRNDRFRELLPAALGTTGVSVSVRQQWLGRGATRRR